MAKIAAIIPAAGYSSRMGLFKPLLPLSLSSLVMERLIEVFHEAGIKDIRVVTGHKAHLLVPLLERLGVKAVFNADYARGMYSSIQAGVRDLPAESEAFFLLPADCPFASAATLLRILAAAAGGTYDVVFPVYNGKKGHPPLISTRLCPRILREEPSGGLRELLGCPALSTMEVPVDDAGILRDLDTEEDYRSALAPPMAGYPSRRECAQILAERNTPEHLRAHMQEVARVAGIIAEHLNGRGLRLHLGLISAAGLLHDLARGESDHPRQGQRIVAARGYPAVAEIVAVHMDLPEEYAASINEHSLVFLADKMVQGSRVVSLEKRLQEKLARHKDNLPARQAILKRLETAISIRQKIEAIIGHDLGKLVEK